MSPLTKIAAQAAKVAKPRLRSARAVSRRTTAATSRQMSHSEDSFEGDSTFKLTADRPIDPSFPAIMIMLAVLKDILDPLDLTILLMIFTKSFTILVGIGIFVWTRQRLSGGAIQRKRMKYWARYAAMLLVEMMPFISIVPATTFFVWMVYKSQLKAIEEANEALGLLRYLPAFKK